MTLGDLLPAATMSGIVLSVICGVQVLPFGTARLLVHVQGRDLGAALAVAARADAALVSAPAPGFAVVFGDAAHVRAALGLAVVWKGRPPCSQQP